ncbi:MAG: hypothetical protein AAFP69_08005 [Planctomycetota bacterium]
MPTAAGGKREEKGDGEEKGEEKGDEEEKGEEKGDEERKKGTHLFYFRWEVVFLRDA